MTSAGTIKHPQATPGLEWVVEADREGAIHLFNRYPVAFARGSGSFLYDTDGKEYVDLLMGIAVCGLGHCHPAVVTAIQEQVATLAHTSNLFYIPQQAKLASRLHQLSGGYLSYFANSGAEANECAIKLARKHGMTRQGGRFEILTALNSFHGRTMATISATGQEKVKKGFGPMLPGFRHVPFNDIEALRTAISSETAGVMLELIQAESYNIMPRPGYLEAVRKLCDEKGILLIFDEVQTGIARSGELFAWQLYGVEPDIFTLAKALGNGFPVSACLARSEAAAAFEPGDHGGTYGGNPVACAAANAVLDTIEREGILELVRKSGRIFQQRLGVLKDRGLSITDVRGIGLILAVELSVPKAREVVVEGLRRGLVINAISDSVIRLRPALNIRPEEIERGMDRFEESLRQVVG